jgi:hypothetical protein
MMRWTGAALLATALTLFGQWRMLPTADVSWLLYAAGRVLDGARIGRDVIDVNFPLVILEKLPAVFVARTLSVDPWHVLLVWLVLLLLVALLLAARVPGSWFAEPSHACLAALVLMAAPRGDFAQREHVAVLAALPYVVLAGARIERRAVRGRLALVTGALAALGLALKPFFVLVPLALLLLQWRRGWRPAALAVLPEHGALFVGIALLWVAQFVAAPAWLDAVRWYWPLYSRYGGGLAVQVGVLLGGMAAFAIAGWLAWRWRSRGHLDAEGEALVVAALGFFLCIVVQARSLSYHFVPVVTLVALVALRWLTQRRTRAIVPAALAAALVVAIALRAPWDGARLLAGLPVQRSQEDPYLSGLQRALGSGPVGRRVAVLSTNPASVFPLLPSIGAETPFRQLSLWPLIGLYAPAVYGDTVVTCAEPAAWGALERHWRDEVAEDLQQHESDALVVLEPDLATRGWGDARRIDYLACLRRDARVRSVLDAFTESVRVGPYRVVRRPLGGPG